MSGSLSTPIRGGLVSLSLRSCGQKTAQEPDIAHQFILQSAIQLVSDTLIVYLETDIQSGSVSELNSLLLSYYGCLERLANQKRSGVRTFDVSVIFPLPNCDIRSLALLSPQVDAVFFLNDGELLDVRRTNVLRAEGYLPSLQEIRLHVPYISDENCKQASDDNNKSKECSLPIYNQTVIGGTFDHLHEGHKILITVAAVLARAQLVVGLSVDELLVKKQYKEQLEPWFIRMKRTKMFVALVNPRISCDIVPLRDMYGPSGDRPELGAIVVSQETEKGGELVNLKRNENGVGFLDVFVVGLVGDSSAEGGKAEKKEPTASPAVSIAGKVSSTEIRRVLALRSHDMCSRLRCRFFELFRFLGCHEESVLNSWWSLVFNSYSEPHRAYHTLAHIDDLLQKCDTISDQLRYPAVVRQAIWFHDVVYDPRAKDSEDRSEQLYRKFSADAKLSSAANEESVSQFILATKSHSLASNMPTSLAHDLVFFLDIDLGVLAWSPVDYDEYARAIRLEYTHMSDVNFTSGRAAVLSSFLKRPLLFHSDYFRARWTQQAVANISRELKQLGLESPPDAPTADNINQ